MTLPWQIKTILVVLGVGVWSYGILEVAQRNIPFNQYDASILDEKLVKLQTRITALEQTAQQKPALPNFQPGPRVGAESDVRDLQRRIESLETSKGLLDDQVKKLESEMINTRAFGRR